MDTAMPMVGPAARMARPALAQWTLATLLGGVALLVYMQVFLVRGFTPPIALMFGVPALVFAALVALIRRRWAPLLGTLYWALFLAANSPYIGHDLAHPELFSGFWFSVVLTLIAVAGVAAGVGAAVQNYRTPNAGGQEANWRRIPRWFSTGLLMLSALCLGAVLVAAIAPSGASAGVSAETLAALPALTTANHKFDQAELHATAGETVALRLENADASGHSFDIDEFNLHVSMPAGEAGLALFTPTTPGRYTFYCSIPGHREAGMVGTLVVEPLP
jgi:uncharacterized cupredoxin-like copper-binding protein